MNVSVISQKELLPEEAIKISSLREGMMQFLFRNYPQATPDDFISLDELNMCRRLYLAFLIEEEQGELANIDQDVMKAIQENTILSENIKEEHERMLTYGEKLADKIASFGGSWTFIALFFIFILGWMFLNILFLKREAFDPYPFILLNLILSCIAAIQAPIIMMSQNRQEQKDRQQAEHDYKINLKAELEIKLLSEKLDYMLIHQNRKLIEIQQIQIDYLEDLVRNKSK